MNFNLSEKERKDVRPVKHKIREIAQEIGDDFQWFAFQCGICGFDSSDETKDGLFESESIATNALVDHLNCEHNTTEYCFNDTLKTCQCEHISHFPEDKPEIPSHPYFVKCHGVEPFKTIYGTFHACFDCRKNHLSGFEKES